MSSLLKLLTAFFSIILHDPPSPTRRGNFPEIRRHAWLRGGGGGTNAFDNSCSDTALTIFERLLWCCLGVFL